MSAWKENGIKALTEIALCVEGIDDDRTEALVALIAAAHRICLYGCGREGLMMRSLAMRLYHLGLDAHMVFDMNTPPVSEGDLLIVSCGPGSLSTVEALVRVATEAGATTVCISAEPDGPTCKLADFVFEIPAQTMANDQNGPASILPMGSLFEATQFIFFEMLILQLRERIGETPDSMRARHTNLE